MRTLPPATRRTACTIALATTLGVLTACTGTTTTISTSTPATTIPVTSAATAAAPAGGPAMVPAPTSSSAAIDAANQTLLGYFQASFTSAHAGGTRLDLVTPWATGVALENERTLATYLQQQQYRVDGTPLVWSLSTTKSEADTETTTDRRTIPYGYVQLVGCTQSTNHPVGTGAPAWTTKNRWLRERWTVIYDASKQQWRVNRQTVLGAKNGTTTCDG